MKIICDTNIWYDLGKGRLIIPEGNEEQLICTYLSLYELNHTEKLINDFELVKKACIAVNKYSKVFIMEPPFLYLRNLLMPTEVLQSKTDFKQAIENITLMDELDKLLLIELQKYLDIKNGVLGNAFTNHLTQEINLLRSVIHEGKESKFEYKQITKRPFVTERKIESIKRNIIQELGREFSIDQSFYSEMFWKQIEFYMQGRLRYFEVMKINKNMMVQNNDAVDLFNLIYVNSDCLYWTNDDRWRNILQEAKLDHMLFHPKW